MAAPIVTHHQRLPHTYSTAEIDSARSVLADVRKIAPQQTAAASQLWEREAERATIGRINYHALVTNQWERMCDARNKLGTHSGRPFVRGPLAQHKAHGMAPWIDRQASGIIRAGERVK